MDDGQAEPRALPFVAGMLGRVERIEDMVQIAGRDARAGVGHFNLDPRVVA
jgi:hypothetical protein